MQQRADPRLSIVIRSHNEEAHIAKLLLGIREQILQPEEVILVDSGSTDSTVAIASALGARVLPIAKRDFTFGRALNVGCRAAQGEILVFASAHVYPEGRRWLQNLVQPLETPGFALSYGKQRGGATNKYSEHRLFCKWFPRSSSVPQEAPFCNNANCAIRRDVWESLPYDESLTGLEDLDWAKRAQALGWQIAYRADAGIIHVHDESWPAIRNRYRREAMAMRHIDPGVRLGAFDVVRLLPEHVLRDSYAALRDGVLHRRALEIVLFRYNQLLGSWQGFADPEQPGADLANRFYYPPRRSDPKEVDDVEDEPIDYTALAGRRQETPQS